MRVLDLSMRIQDGMLVFPAYPVPKVLPWTALDKHGFRSNILLIPEHVGTQDQPGAGPS